MLGCRLIEDGLREGNWVFLANCHLMTSWLPTLDKIIEGFESRAPHEDFRCAGRRRRQGWAICPVVAGTGCG